MFEATSRPPEATIARLSIGPGGGARLGIFEALSPLAEMADAAREDERARAYCHQTLEVGMEAVVAPAVVVVRWIAADCARRRGQPGAGARLLGAADAWRAQFGGPLYPSPVMIRDREQAVRRGGLGAEVHEAEWTAGRSMTLEEALTTRAPLEIPAEAG